MGEESVYEWMRRQVDEESVVEASSGRGVSGRVDEASVDKASSGRGVSGRGVSRQVHEWMRHQW